MSKPLTMNHRERWLAAMTFGQPDRLPFEPGWPRESTLRRWREEGLPEGSPWQKAHQNAVGIAIPDSPASAQPHAPVRMNPMFEEKVLSRRDGHLILRDWMGNIVEIDDRFDASHIRHAVDFVTRKWHAFPVADRADFEKMKQRYRVDDPFRRADDPAALYAALRGREHVAHISVPGPFWQMREWCGFEPLCRLLIDDPDFVHEMASFWMEFVSAVLAPAFREGAVDALFISEDMAYKQKSMISPAAAREFLGPVWKRWTREAAQGGVRVVSMDCDGCVDELIPLWIEAGLRACDPVEVAAGCDLPAYRRRFGRQMAYRGGVDKRAIAKGGQALADEIARVAPVALDGGYIPGCDHGVPSDISWPNFVAYGRLLAELGGWL